MEEFNILIAVIAFIILFFGIIKKYVEASYVSEPAIALLAGILIGPEIIGWVDWHSWNKPFEMLHQITRFTLSIALMSAAVRIPPGYIKQHYRSLLTMLFGAMLLMALIASCCYLIIGLSPWNSILLGAILTPTDPVLATTIVSGFYAENNVPERLRFGLSFESAANDGLAYPLVLLPLAFMFMDHPAGTWIFKIILWENLGAIVLGAISGYLINLLFNYYFKKDSFEAKTLLATTLATAFLLTTLLSLIKMNGIIGVFAAGLVFTMGTTKKVDAREERVNSMMERLFIVPVFVLLGVMLPWKSWAEMTPAMLVISTLVLFLRRMPTLYILKPLIGNFSWRDTFFAGWFGPVGVAALFYCTYAMIHYPELKDIWPVVTYVIALSTIVFGISAYPLTRKLYAERQ